MMYPQVRLKVKISFFLNLLFCVDIIILTVICLKFSRLFLCCILVPGSADGIQNHTEEDTVKDIYSYPSVTVTKTRKISALDDQKKLLCSVENADNKQCQLTLNVFCKYVFYALLSNGS